MSHMMNQVEKQEVIGKVAETLVRASTTFPPGKMEAYQNAYSREDDEKARWVISMVTENAAIAERSKRPMCDDTGIPHVFLEVGPNRMVTGELIGGIKEGVREGLRRLPGRPMAILGDDAQRIDQSLGMSDSPEDVELAPIVIKKTAEDVLRVHILMQGGGPAIRGMTYRIFHKHSIEVVLDEICRRAAEGVNALGCSPCTLAIGLGRSHLEAAALMEEALVFGDYAHASQLEDEITQHVNSLCSGPMNLGGHTSVLATFLKVGPQRASGVRIASIRPSCCFEPRRASVDL